MKRISRVWIGIFISVILIVVVGVGGAFLWTTRRPFPKTEGRVEIAGLERPVEVIRDENGVPHIYAETPRDLYLTQGFVHAQDRFWQMEFWRRIGSGRLSELFGEATLGTDRLIRTMGFADIAAREYALLPELRPNVKTKFPTGLRNFFPGILYPANGRGSSDTNDWYASSGVRYSSP